MNNTEVIDKLQQSVDKLEADKNTLKTKRNRIPGLNEKQRQQRDTLTSLIADMIANKNALEAVINEREGASAGSIPPLSPDLVAKFKDQMEKLNVVIQADQNFDKIVAIAKGINSAAAEMEETTKV